MRCIHSTAFGLMPPTALFSTTPPNTSIPGTTFITSAARLAVSLMWFLSRMPRMPRDLASCATSMSSMLRPNTSGCECTCMSITPTTGLTFGGGGGKAACAKTCVAEKASARPSAFLIDASRGCGNRSRKQERAPAPAFRNADAAVRERYQIDEQHAQASGLAARRIVLAEREVDRGGDLREMRAGERHGGDRRPIERAVGLPQEQAGRREERRLLPAAR